MGERESDRTAAPHQQQLKPFVYHTPAKEVAAIFDYKLPQHLPAFTPYDLKPLLEEPFSIGVIVGSSGSGKTQALIAAGYDPIAMEGGADAGVNYWHPAFCLLDHFVSGSAAVQAFTAAGLNSVPQWFKPYHMLSNGEQYRATLARRLYFATLHKKVLFVDEFTSTVDRTVARSLCKSLNRHTLTHPKIVVSTCHHDVLQWLRWDWAVNTDTNEVNRPQERATTSHWRVYIDDKVGEIRRG